MKTSPWLRLLFSAMAVFALALFAACGDDDDDDNEEGRDPTSSSTDGDDQSTPDTDDDDDDDNDGGSSGGGGGDAEDYVTKVCTSMNDFVDELISAGSDPDAVDATEEEQLELFREPFAGLIDALDDADAPGDIAEYHNDLLDAFREVLERIEDGDVTAFESDPFDELPEPPAAVQEKYSALANSVPECASIGVFGEE